MKSWRCVRRLVPRRGNKGYIHTMLHHAKITALSCHKVQKSILCATPHPNPLGSLLIKLRAFSDEACGVPIWSHETGELEEEPTREPVNTSQRTQKGARERCVGERRRALPELIRDHIHFPPERLTPLLPVHCDLLCHVIMPTMEESHDVV